MGMDRLRESKRQLEAINATSKIPEEDASPKRYRRTSGPLFEERFRRVTTYVENDLFRQIESLREQGKILSLTALFNDSIRNHLKENFGKGS